LQALIFSTGSYSLVPLSVSVEQRLRIKALAQVGDESILRFLGFSLNLNTSDFTDDLQQGVSEPELLNPTMHHQIAELLIEYSNAQKNPLAGKPTKFRDFPGGIAYENAFVRKAIDPVAHGFSDCPELFVEAALLLGGRRLELGQASVEISALNGVPLTYILWVDEDLPPSVNLLFDQSACGYLNAEGLANLAELTTWRLLLVQKLLKNSASPVKE
jgi:hypothetical protein